MVLTAWDSDAFYYGDTPGVDGVYPCMLDMETNCASSSQMGHSGQYVPNDKCTITITQDGILSAPVFNIAPRQYDVVRILPRYTQYYDSNGPDGVIVSRGDQITWEASSAGPKNSYCDNSYCDGWTICWTGQHPNPTASCRTRKANHSFLSRGARFSMM